MDTDGIVNYEERRSKTKLPDLSGLSKDELIRLRSKLRRLHELDNDSKITKEIRRKKRKEPHYFREKREREKEIDCEREMRKYVKY